MNVVMMASVVHHHLLHENPISRLILIIFVFIQEEIWRWSI